jgi:hypothetical protein
VVPDGDEVVERRDKLFRYFVDADRRLIESQPVELAGSHRGLQYDNAPV